MPGMVIIELTKGFSTKVDDQDADELKQYSWCVVGPTNGGYYAVSRIKDKFVYMARLLVNAKKGDYVDHKNGDTLDNRRLNLRLFRNGEGWSANSANVRNSKLSKRNKTGERGVYWHEKRKCFVVDARANGKRFQRQTSSLEEASRIFREFMEQELGQDFEKEIYPKQFATIGERNATH